jgi:hypothetical protein
MQFMKEYSMLALWIFNLTYLFWGGVYFVQDLNLEFVIYVGVLILIIGTVLLIADRAHFPHWQVWLLSVWGLLHVLGGAVETKDGVLFAYHIYPFLDWGGEFYILKYDQFVHFYLYGVVALMANHVIRLVCKVSGYPALVFLAAVLISVGVSALNEIMEFLIAVSIDDNGVGGYENAMLDLIFNLSGAVFALAVYYLLRWKKQS